ncbi:tandem-95 repeat protein [Roseiconus nitratireducens]|uniref:Tandem-95 repeat protein n=1 Tax=Roseiconus nitratireducens TaxID=2605748 RepID=A0A5M6DL66_9BACT|nr:tandem-95 repeat protein [Roseiconus nitratireducens]KAA5546992.1 tandem-95 repeat protein [Roseiconus nitratireducens]
MSNRRVHAPSLSDRQRRRIRQAKKSRARRNLLLEFLEQRQLLAVGPRLIDIESNFGDSIDATGPTLRQAPNQLKVSFSSNDSIDQTSVSSGIQLIGSGGDGTFGDGNELAVDPAFIGLGGADNEVLIRFAETLPDDRYQITVRGAGSPVTNTDGDPFNNGVDVTREFQLEKGARVLSVVPQPVTRDPVSGALSQALDEVHVYFNDDMNVTSVEDRAFYRLEDKTTGEVRLPSSASYDAAERMVALTFAEDLPAANFHLQIGEHHEANSSLGAATNLGTISQQAPFAVYETPIELDDDGNPITLPIPDMGSVVSSIAVDQDFLVRDVEVQVDIDHEAGEDLQVFLVSPSGRRVELIRDLGSDQLQGQIYGTKFNDLDGDGVQDPNEPGLAGWTIFLDVNDNAVLDPFERSTVTDADGNYSFVGLPRGVTYTVAEVNQPFWQQTSFTSGGEEVLFSVDFSDGSTQYLDIIPDPIDGLADDGFLFLFYDGSAVNRLPDFTGVDQETADRIEFELQQLLDPGLTVDVSVSSTTANRFEINFTRTGVGTPYDSPIVQVTPFLNRGTAELNTVASSEGFFNTSPFPDSDEWHLTKLRGNDSGHSGEDSFYFGTEPVPPATQGQYQNNAIGSLFSPVIDLTDPALPDDIQLQFNHRLAAESGFDYARIFVRSAEGELLGLPFENSSGTGGWVSESVDLSAFRGREIQLEFNFDSDGSVINEGWFVDDIRVTTTRGVASVSLGTGSQAGIVKSLPLGSMQPIFGETNQFGYRAQVVNPTFEDISVSGERILQEYVGQGFVKDIGGLSTEQSNAIARDDNGNVYLTGVFQGTVDFDPSTTGTFELTSDGINDIFVAKYDSAGNFVWAKSYGGTGVDTGRNIEVDASGNVYFTGSFSGTADFDGTPVVSNGNTDSFVAKLDTDGNLQWVRRAGSATADEGAGLALDASGNVLVTGQFTGAATFGTVPLTSVGSSDAFVWVLDNDGNTDSAFSIGSSGTDRGREIAVDGDGNITITGAFSGSVDFNLAGGATNIDLLSSLGSTDGFVVQYAADGTFRWANQIGSAVTDDIKAVAIDADNNVLVTGANNNDIVVVKYDQDGNQQWTRSFGAGSTDSGEDIAVDDAGRAYVTGTFRSSFSGITSNGGTDIFLLRLTADGATDVLTSMGGFQDDAGLGVATDDDGNFLHTGSFRSTVEFDLGPTTESLVAVGSQDMYLATYSTIRGIDDGTQLITASDLTDPVNGQFRFSYFGNTYTDLYVSTNGVITFVNPNATPDNGDLTDSPLQASILPFWEDLFTSSGPEEAVFWEVRGRGGDQRLIIQWNNVRLDGLAGADDPPLTFQVVLRESDDSIQFNYETVTGAQFIPSEETTVGTFEFGNQQRPAIASDAAGNSLVVWQSPGQSGQSAIYARRFDASGNPLPTPGNPAGDEFLIPGPGSSDVLPAVAMNASGDAVVAWYQTDVATQIYVQRLNATGALVGTPIKVNTIDGVDSNSAPEIVIDDLGNFTVAWGAGDADGDSQGLIFRRFDAAGNPLDARDEIQTLEFLGPPASPRNFTLLFNGSQTNNISYAGVNRGNITAANIQTRLRQLASLGNQVNVTPIDLDEVQTIRLGSLPTDGTFELSYQGTAIANAITFDPADAAANAAAIQTELRALANIDAALTVTAVSLLEYRVNFGGADGSQDLPLLQVSNNGLNPATTIDVEETVKGSNPDVRFQVAFRGQDGSQDQPLISLGDFSNGVTHVVVEEVQQGTTGEIRANTYIPDRQLLPALALADNGELSVGWSSELQDGSGWGVYAKRFDSNGEAIPGDLNEIQEIELLGPPSVGSTYRLAHEGQQTGVINYTGNNVFDAAEIQSELNAIGRNVVVTPASGTSDEVQLISFTDPPNEPTGGTFRLAHAGQITAAIDYAGTTAANGVTTANNIQAELRALGNTGNGITVVPAFTGATRDFLVTFAGADGGVDQPLMLLFENNLDDGSATITEINQGGRSNLRFQIEFVGADGNQDRGNVTLADNTGGVVDMDTVVIQDGNDSEFLVPENTLGNQLFPHFSPNPAGGFLAVWESPDGDGIGVVGRLFDDTGSPSTSEFQINTLTSGSQNRQQSTFLTNGDFLVTWFGPSIDGSSTELYGRRFTGSGIALGDEFVLNQIVAGVQDNPTITALPGGAYAVAFESSAGGGGVHLQIFDSNDTPVGAEQTISQFGQPDKADVALARNASGQTVFAWTENRRDEDLSQGVYAQTFDANGNPISGEFLVAEVTDGDQNTPQVGIDDAGNVVVVWRTLEIVPDPANPGEFLNTFPIKGRRFDINGVALGGEFTPQNQGTNSTEPLLSVAGDGEFVISFEPTNGIPEFFAYEAFDAAGNSVAAELVVRPEWVGSVDQTSVAYAPSGDFFVVAWDADVEVDGFIDVQSFFQIFEPDGTPRTQPVVVEGESVRTVQVGIDGAGNITATWTSNAAVNFGAYLSRFDSAGNSIAEPVQVYDVAVDTKLAVSEDGSASVLFEDFNTGQTYVQRITDRGLLMGDPVPISGGTDREIAVDDSSEYQIAWLENNQIHTFRYTSDFPSVGIRDAGVQQPGEDLLQIWIDGSRTPFVGSGLSTRISVAPEISNSFFAISNGGDTILELDSVTGATLNSIPTPVTTPGSGSLAQLGTALYFVADGDSTLYTLDSATGAWINTVDLAALGLSNQIDALAVLNGQLVLQDSGNGNLVFFDPFDDEIVQTVKPAQELQGGLVGGGDRGTLFGINASGDIVELDPQDGSVLATLTDNGDPILGLAFVDGFLAAARGSSTITRIDPDSGASLGTLTSSLPVTSLGGDGGGGIAQAFDPILEPFPGTLLDDEATVSITSGQGPYVGSYRPADPLSAFDGEQSLGDWQLEVRDTMAGDVGQLNQWRLILNDPDDTPADFATQAFIGDELGVGANDVDLYRVNFLDPGNVDIRVTPDAGLNVTIRLFDEAGNELARSTVASVGELEQLIAATPAAGVYYIGVSSSGNDDYDPNNTGSSSGGTTTGGYALEIRFDQVFVADDDNSSYLTATDVGVLGDAGFMRSAEIDSPDFNLRLPGGIDDPGHRDVPYETHLNGGPRSNIVTAPYNFQDDYGVLPSGDRAVNAITENQKDRAREIFEIYGKLLGIQFYETASSGLTVVTGDMRAISPDIPVGPGGVAGLSEGSLFGRVIMDAAENWGTSLYGGGWFQTAMHEIGHSLGLGHTYEQPALTVMGDRPQNRFDDNGEPIFPGPVDVIHAKHILAPSSRDLDLYRFELVENGTLTAETFAERFSSGVSLLDTELSLYRETTQNGRVTRELIASNDDYFGDDSRIQLHLGPGTYYLGVHSSGLEDIDPGISDSGFGGISDGRYEVELNFVADAKSQLQDASGGAFDGDSDGAPGGVYDFWFQSGPTIFVDKMNDTSSGADGDGSIADPFDSIPSAFAAARTRIVVPTGGASAINEGDTLVVIEPNDNSETFVFEFAPASGISNRITIAEDATDVEVAQAIADAINDPDVGWTVTASVNGSIVQLSGIERRDLSGAPGLIQSSNLVRIVGNGGDDGDLATATDNRAYLVGQDNDGATLIDGLNLNVPQGVTVMVDAAALFKMQRSIVDVGTSSQNINRGGAALQLLGTPNDPVLFRSFRNDAFGGDDDGPGVAPESGDWGGIVIRADSDLEDQGIFLNHINLADLNNGGGKVTIDSLEQTFTPVHLIGARPTISNLAIRGSADAAVSADPNSFEESLGRIGPDIHDNLIVDNSINGLFIRIRTDLGQPLDQLDVPARFDDTDIVHVLTETLQVAGNPGGPDATSGQLVARSGARLAIDPGTIVKLEGARIEVEIGGQLIAEGSEGSEVIFTALKDDTYGAGGTSDTTNDADNTMPQAGQWGGIYFGHSSSGSLDHILLQYGGGETAIEGDFDNFNPIEIHQGEVRIANSVFRRNLSGTASSDRNGRGRNDNAVIFVRGAQPVLVGNQIYDNPNSMAITIDVNSLQASTQADPGRQTGALGAFTEFVDNYGPLVRLNRLQDNDLNGMEVRGGVLKTEGAWDDVDVAHVVRDEIKIPNFHSLGGLRLQSTQAGSLVVKLAGADAGFTATGDPLDISDRIGGSLYVLGATNRPVIFTSLDDDTVAAGFDLAGELVFDTNNDGASEGQAGDWRSLRLDRFSNDRNVAIRLENENARIGQNDINSTPTTAEFLGTLSVDDKNGDDDRRVGFTVLGKVALDNPADADVYSFDANPGTEVWIDIDRTDSSLDVVVELIDSDGVVLASALNNSILTGIAQSLNKDSSFGGDLYTSNPRDAGMRLTLPAGDQSVETYYVRVRSARPGEVDPDVVEERSRGSYQMQIRLRQIDEVPGSTIRAADIRYATNGIEVLGLPAHSHLTGEAAESSAGNNTFGSAQQLGNLLVSERSTISLAGDLSAANDIDWYQFELDIDQVQAIGGVNDGGKTWSTIFDIDYADGLARPDTVLAVFDENGIPILISRDSNVQDDRALPGQGTSTEDLTRGSVGSLDPFIGSVQMPTGLIPAGASRTYYVAVASNGQLPTALSGTFNAGSGSSLVRLEPVNSVRRIAEDHIGFSGHTTGTEERGFTTVTPVQTLFDIDSSATLATNVIDFTLNEMVLYVGGPSGLSMVNPFTGDVIDRVGDLNVQTSDFAMRTDGRMFAMRSLFQGNPPPNNSAGALVSIDPATAGQTVVGNDGIADFDPNTNPPNIQQLTSNNVEALAYNRTGFNNNNNTPNYSLYYAVQGNRGFGGSQPGGATLYRANPANGSAATAQGQPWGRIGTISTTFTPTGMAFVNDTLYGVDDSGQLFSISTTTGAATVIANLGFSFEGLSAGPTNLQGGTFADLLFGVTGDGTLVAFDTNGVLQGVFAGGASSISTGVSSTGLAFSPLDFNLWHPTLRRRNDAGHGINSAFDLSREDPSDFNRPYDTDEAEGGVSFYFGMEDWPVQNDQESYIPYDGGGQYGVSFNTQRDLSTNPDFANNYNLPGGALGSLATNPFSLAGYDSADKPTIYFNYFMDTQNVNADANDMRDSFRVQLSTNGGASWSMLATNNSLLDEELPEFVSTSSNASFDFRQRVQELFDNTGGWRQARIDLSEFAGASNIQVRFDFSTSGSMNQGIPGDIYGDAFDVSRARNNDFEGVYIDDVIIGFAERGEMVTDSNPGSQTGFFQVPRVPDAPEEVLAGRYQLEIRRGTEYAINVSDTDPEIVVLTQYDTNDRMILGEGITRFGDQNTRRETGQIQIEQNAIKDSLQYGIVVDAGARNSDGDLPSPSSVRNLPTVNAERLVPGITIENNVIAVSGNGGILFSGDPNSGAVPLAAVPYGRILNNTIFGGEQPTGTGINVTENASPTLLNNIIANTDTAISIDGTSSSTVVGATLLQGNNNPGNFSDNTMIPLESDDPLFVDPLGGNFYLAQGSPAIDSSRNTLQDRPSIVAVKSPLGISPSPITTPDRDLFNQFRIDDPTQDPPPGLGSDIFKDRGAIERADFVGPTVQLLNPEDNDAGGIDLDQTFAVVQLASGELTSFDILFSDDPGIGPDPATITPGAISVTENGFLLTSETDYFARFNPNNGILSLTPSSGQWSNSSVFVITLDNTVITDLAGNPLQPNRPNGTTQFTILMPDVELDFGDAPNSYGTLGTAGGPRHAISDTQTPRLGDLVDSEVNGQPVNQDDTNGVDDEDGVPVGAFVGSSTVNGVLLADASTGQTSNPNDVLAFLNRNDAAGAVLPIQVTGSGVIDAWIDFNRDGDFNENNERVLSGAAVVDGLNQLRVFTPANASVGMTYARFRISSEGTNSPGGIANNGEVEDYQIGIFDVAAADAVDDDFYVVSEDDVLTVDGGNFAGLVANDVLPNDEFVTPQIVIDGTLVPHPTDTIYQTANGQVRVDDPVLGLFTYTPNLDFEGVDTFRYAVSTQRNNGPEFLATADFATVSITVTPFNSPPEFDIPTEVEVFEDDPATWVVDSFFTNVVGGSPDKGTDEQGQTVTFTIQEVSSAPTNLMTADPDVSSGSSIEFFPATDIAGTAVYVVTGTDNGSPAESVSKTFTVNVRPVNDPPRFDPDVAGTGEVNNPDDAYAVARQVDPATGLITDATITYTLREDVSQPIGDPPQSYFIPFSRDPSATGYNPVGLMDVFTVGPDNEADPAIEGGGQTLSMGTVPMRTVLGGTLTVGVDAQNRPGVYYTPPLDYNNQIGGPDSFVYTVVDDGTSYVGGQLVPDPKSSSNVVQLVLNPVNDKPQFSLNLPPADLSDPTGARAPIETPEDSAATQIENFAFNIEAGPPTTAFDEVDAISGQDVQFSITPLSFSASEASDFFSEFPTITPEGTLRFRPAANAFGSFDFEVVLTDDGTRDPNRGDLFESDPQTFTVDVLPVNDAPVVRTDIDPLSFTMLEDGSVEIYSRGDATTPGLLDVFAVGPDNEAADLTPGGNQTLALKEPTPRQTAFGGTITEIRDNGQLIGLRYTPRQNFVGTDSFIYTVTDDGVTVDVGSGQTVRQDPRIASNTVSIEVQPVNDAPQFSGPSSVVVDEDAGMVSIDDWATNVFSGPPTATDELASQDVFFVITQTGGDTGLFASEPTAVVDDNDHTAQLQFETAADANGQATFTVQLFDIPTDGTTEASSAVRTFTLTINAVNDAPTFDSPMDPITVDEDSGPYAEPWATNISPGPSDESDQTVRFEVVTPVDAQDLFQTLPQISDDGILRFVPAPNANGTVDLSVTAIDSADGVSSPLTLRLVITALNDPPVAVADDLMTDEDTPLMLTADDLLANDVDPDVGNPDDTLTLLLPEDGFSLSGARVTYNPATGEIVYDPTTATSLQAIPSGQSGVDSFTYSLRDSQGVQSNTVTVAVTVEGVNDAPMGVADNPTLNPSGPTVINVLANDSDVDGEIDPTSIDITLQPAFGSLSIDNNGVITFTAFQSFSTEDQFRYRVADFENAYSEEVLVTISANAAPIARDDQAGTYLNEPVDINVVLNDEDPDAEAGAPDGGLNLQSIEVVGGPNQGSAVVLNDGTIRYIPASGFVGVDSFQYTITDSEGRTSSPGTVRVQVTASRLQNPNLFPDVNDDGNISPIDALLVINRLARADAPSVPVTENDMGPPFYDVNGDQRITPSDALGVINELARRSALGEGESVSSDRLQTPTSTSAAIAKEDSDAPAIVSDNDQPLAVTGQSETEAGDDLIDLLAQQLDESSDEATEDRLAALDIAFGDLL